ncbi:polymerase delta-interacting protein 3 [Gastrophryne carolinensis]
MADVSLDEVIRKKRLVSHATMSSGVNARGTLGGIRSEMKLPLSRRPLINSFQKSFDARQKIGVTDARFKLGMKDAREKLIAKDARFRIKGKIQDAREMLNSRKHQMLSGGKAAKVMDAREKISLKRSAPALTGNSPVISGSSTINITKTIQIPQKMEATSGVVHSVKGMRINVVNNQLSKQFSQPEVDDEAEDEIVIGHIPAKQMKITAANNLQKRAGMSLPLTKVVQNDTYTAPTATLHGSTTPLHHAKTLTGVSRTLVAKEATPAVQPALKEPVFSPLEGTKMIVNNLHPRVTEEDIVELFCVCGALKRARLLSPGVAEVVFVRKEDAVGAYKKYNNRYLDGQPMKCNLHLKGTVITSDQPILLRLSDTPSATKKEGELRRNSSNSSASNPAAEVDPDTVLKALFKSSGSSAVVQPTAFKIKL